MTKLSLKEMKSSIFFLTAIWQTLPHGKLGAAKFPMHNFIQQSLHNFIQQSLNSGSAQVQILHAACWRFAMVRISDNGPDWK